jgi:hypothetical protein
MAGSEWTSSAWTVSHCPLIWGTSRALTTPAEAVVGRPWIDGANRHPAGVLVGTFRGAGASALGLVQPRFNRGGRNSGGHSLLDKQDAGCWSNTEVNSGRNSPRLAGSTAGWDRARHPGSSSPQRPLRLTIPSSSCWSRSGKQIGHSQWAWPHPVSQWQTCAFGPDRSRA